MPFNFLHPFGFICRFPPVGLSTTSCVYVVSISEFLLHPCASQQLPACIWFQYLGFPCLSTTSCAHLVSISNFPPVPLIKLPKLPAFIGFQYLYFPRSLPTTSCVHFVLISKLPPRCPSTTSCIHLASIFPVPLSNFLHSFGFISGSTVAS